MRTVKLAGIAFFLCAGLVLGDDAKTDPKSKDKLPAADFKLAAGEYAKELRKDSNAAKAKYKDKIVELSGSVTHAAQGFEGKGSYLSIETPDPNVRVGNPDVMCTSNDPQFFSQFGKGQTIRIKGKANFLGILDACEVVEKGKDTRILVDSETLAKDFTADSEKALEKYEKKTLIVSGKISAIKPYPGLKVKYAELAGDGKTVIECRYSDANLVEKFKIGQEIKVYGQIATSDKGMVNIAPCYPIDK